MKTLLASTILAISLLMTANSAIIDLGTTTANPSSVSAELSRLTGQINLYNGVSDPDLPSSVGLVGTQVPGNGLTGILLSLPAYNGYISMKWGPMNHFYYLNDSTPSPNVPSTVLSMGNSYYWFFSDIIPGVGLPSNPGKNPPPNLGLSHYTTFEIPEPTATAGALFCLGIGVFASVRRVRK